MANIKRLIALSEWQTYELEPSKVLDLPSLKIKIKPIDSIAGLNADEGDRKFSAMIREMLIDAVQEWDIADDGKPIPCNDETKRIHLPFIFQLKLKDKNSFLWLELLNYAGDIENFIRP